MGSDTTATGGAESGIAASEDLTSTTATDPDCVFCKIVRRDIPAEVVAETEHSLAFRDLAPQAPTHVLVIPKRHVANALGLAEAADVEMADLVRTAGAVAASEGLDDGYRLVFNTGAAAHQMVFHAHLHVLGGRSMLWPPG